MAKKKSDADTLGEVLAVGSEVLTFISRAAPAPFGMLAGVLDGALGQIKGGQDPSVIEAEVKRLETELKVAQEHSNRLQSDIKVSQANIKKTRKSWAEIVAKAKASR